MEPQQFIDANLHGARFTRTDLGEAVMRGVLIEGADIEAPWLLEAGSTLLINGVDVVPLVDAELNRRWSGRSERRADTPEGLQSAWAALEAAWAGVLLRVETMPDGTVDISVDGEWSFSQTLRHLVMATDTWLRRAILDVDQPLHPIGQPNVEYETDGYDMSVFANGVPAYAAVLGVRAGRVAMVRDFIATVSAEDLQAPHPNPWNPEHPETTLSCLHTILEEEWEHLRYAVRDLDAIASKDTSTSTT